MIVDVGVTCLTDSHGIIGHIQRKRREAYLRHVLQFQVSPNTLNKQDLKKSAPRLYRYMWGPYGLDVCRYRKWAFFVESPFVVSTVLAISKLRTIGKMPFARLRHMHIESLSGMGRYWPT